MCVSAISKNITYNNYVLSLFGLPLNCLSYLHKKENIIIYNFVISGPGIR